MEHTAERRLAKIFSRCLDTTGGRCIINNGSTSIKLFTYRSLIQTLSHSFIDRMKYMLRNNSPPPHQKALEYKLNFQSQRNRPVAWNGLRTFPPIWKKKNIQNELWNSYQKDLWILKISELIKLRKKYQQFKELPSYKNVFPNVKRKDIYSIGVRLKSREVELKQWVKLSLAKFVGMLSCDCSYKIRFIFTNTKPSTFRIKTFQTLHQEA